MVIDFENTDMLLDSDTRIVTDPLLQARQAIKQRALARIGITNNRDAGVQAPGNVDFTGGDTNF